MLLNDLMLSTLWDTYKNMEWWKKIITFLPFLLLFILFIVLFVLFRNKPDTEEETEFNTGPAEEKIEEAIENIDEALEKAKEEKEKLEEQQKDIVEEYKDNEKQINDAGTDFNKLTDVAERLRARNASKNRK